MGILCLSDIFDVLGCRYNGVERRFLGLRRSNNVYWNYLMAHVHRKNYTFVFGLLIPDNFRSVYSIYGQSFIGIGDIHHQTRTEMRLAGLSNDVNGNNMMTYHTLPQLYLYFDQLTKTIFLSGYYINQVVTLILGNRIIKSMDKGFVSQRDY